MTMTKNAMLKRVDSYIGTERTSKASLAKLSRDLLTYVYESNDTPMINRLIDGLTPANQRVACQFFPKFVGWEFDKDKRQFGKKLKTKVYDKRRAEAETQLEDASFNMWSWYEAKGEKSEKKPKDHAKAIDNAIKAGLKEEGENKLTLDALVKVMMANDIKLRDLMAAAEKMVGL